MASKNIKGITIDLGGKSTKLEKALKEVEGPARKIQTELRQVERLLKLDPKNTELVAQKQKLLADAVGETSTKLDTLKEAQRQVAEQFRKGEVGEDQYRAIQREVIQTEQDLKKLETQLKQVNSKWDDAQKKLGKFGGKATAAGEAMLPVTAVIGAGGIAAVTMSLSFGDAMAKVNTIADTSKVPLAELEKQIISLSNETGIAAPEIAQNVYDAISAGQDTGDAVAFVGEANKLAKGGFAETGEALDILTTIMNAYGLEASEVGKISDMLIQTQNKGKVEVGELSQFMGKLIPTANATGVELDQVAAAYALLTSNGIKAGEATTYTNALLKELSKNGSKSSKVLEKETGKSFMELTAEGKSLSDILMILNDSAQGDGLLLKDMFGSGEAGTAADVLVKESGDAFNTLRDQMNDSGGAAQEAYEKMITPAEEFRITINQLKNALMEFGNTLKPVFDSVAAGIQKVADFMSGLTPEQRKLIVVMLGLVAAIGPVLIVVGKIATGMSALMGICSGLSGAAAVVGGAIGAISLPVVAVIAAIAAVIAIGVALYKNWDTVKEKAAVALDAVKGAVGKAWEGIKGFTKSLLKTWWDLTMVFPRIGAAIIKGLVKGITNMFPALAKKISETANKVKDGFKKLLGINSPSKVFAGYGENTGEGFIEGIESTRKNIQRATAGIVDLNGVQKGIDGNMNDIGVGAVGSTGSGGHMTLDLNINVTGETGQLNIQHIAAAVEEKLVESITNGDRRTGSRPRLMQVG
jgi:TP901 family phage tail tape measure protein